LASLWLAPPFAKWVLWPLYWPFRAIVKRFKHFRQLSREARIEVENELKSAETTAENAKAEEIKRQREETAPKEAVNGETKTGASNMSAIKPLAAPPMTTYTKADTTQIKAAHTNTIKTDRSNVQAVKPESHIRTATAKTGTTQKKLPQTMMAKGKTTQTKTTLTNGSDPEFGKTAHKTTANTGGAQTKTTPVRTLPRKPGKTQTANAPGAQTKRTPTNAAKTDPRNAQKEAAQTSSSKKKQKKAKQEKINGANTAPAGNQTV
jgi:hypothetical protein